MGCNNKDVVVTPAAPPAPTANAAASNSATAVRSGKKDKKSKKQKKQESKEYAQANNTLPVWLLIQEEKAKEFVHYPFPKIFSFAKMVQGSGLMEVVKALASKASEN